MICCRPTPTEIAEAYRAALAAARLAFSAPARRPHIDKAIDGATDAVLRAGADVRVWRPAMWSQIERELQG